jgi:hypothetical protein
MNGKTHTIRRRLSVIALTASLAALAVPAANAAGVLGPGLNTVQKQGPYGAYWIRKHQAARVLAPGLNTVEKRGPYGAYWVSKATRDNEPSMSEVHLYPLASADKFASTAAITAASANWAAKGKLLDINGQLRRDSFKSSALEHGSNGFLGQTTNEDQGIVRLPRADDPMFREIVQEAAQEHGAAGFDGLDLSIGFISPVRVAVVRDAGDASGSKLSLRPVHLGVVRDAGDATGSKVSLSWKPSTVDYTHLPQEDRP